MPTYEFAVHDGHETTSKTTIELPDLRAARREAVRAMLELAEEELPDDGDRAGMWISITDTEGRELLTASLEFRVSGGR